MVSRLTLHLSVSSMCISPTLIPNPNYRSRFLSPSVAQYKDCVSKYIPIPCGHCAECVRLRATGILERAQLEEKAGWPFFIMLSYNDESLPWHTCSNGRRIRYADISDVQNMFKRLRDSGVLGRRFRYLAVSEFGEKRARPHFHVLLFLERFENDSVYTPINLERLVFQSVLHEWRRNYGSRRNPEYRPLCTFRSRWIYGELKSNYTCKAVVPSSKDGTTQDVSFYLTKYLYKDSKRKDNLKRSLKFNLPIDEFLETWKKVRPRCIKSLNFGFGVYDDLNPRKTPRNERLALLSSLPSSDHVRASVVRSRLTQDRPKFYDVQTGKALPLARYWYGFGFLYSQDDAEYFYWNDPNGRSDNVVIDEHTVTDRVLAEQKLDRITEKDSFNILDQFYE